MIYRILYISGGCLGFLNHQQYPPQLLDTSKNLRFFLNDGFSPTFAPFKHCKKERTRSLSVPSRTLFFFGGKTCGGVFPGDSRTYQKVGGSFWRRFVFFVDDVFLFDFSEKENSLLIVGILESTIPGDPEKRSIRLMVGL